MGAGTADRHTPAKILRLHEGASDHEQETCKTEHHSKPPRLHQKRSGAGRGRRIAGRHERRRRADGEPIPVGQAAPLTDFAAADGIEFKNGLTLACEEINALGGILGRPLEPYFEDTKQMGDATNVQAVQRLIDRHSVHAILNGYNIGSGAAIQDVVADSGIIYIHYDTTIGHNNLIKSDPERYFGSFQGDPAEYWYGPGFLKFVQQLEENGQYKRANNKMAVILSAGVYAANIANAIKEQAAHLRLGDQPVRDRERADLGMGPDAGQDPPGSALRSLPSPTSCRPTLRSSWCSSCRTRRRA